MSSSSIHLDESISASPNFSPGVVLDSEILLRELFNPQHIVDGEIVVTAISLSDLRFRGFSVHRRTHVSYEFIRKAIDQRLNRPRRGPSWKDEGIAEILTEDVRHFDDQGVQLFVVIDTALENHPGHASIFMAKPDMGESHARKLRALLLPLLNKRRQVELVFKSEK